MELALAGARLEVRVGDDAAGSGVELLLGANPGEPALPLAKVASGGELARAMLAPALVLSARAPHAGVRRGGRRRGGRGRPGCRPGAGRARARYQVLVVTHLAQVAAFADSRWS